MNGQIIPEETEKSIEVKQENATFLVIGDKAYTSEIIEEYNRNAEAKTEDFNTNAENKTASYNSNAADRTTAFNNNYDNKISAFNSNANSKTEEFDTHVLMQTNTFNKNAVSTIANYNSNAEQKTNEFNQNALSYQEGIDANKKHIINVSNELERVKNDILETGTDTDTYIHLEDSAMAEYQELSVDGVCEQVTTSINNGDEYDSPSLDHPQPILVIENSLKITSCNKNLIPYMEKGDINSNGEEINSTTILRSGFIKVKPNTTYISSYNNNEQPVTYHCYDKNKQKVGTSSFKSKYTTSDNAEYIRFRIYDNNYDISLFQIEQSDSFTSYEQHLETQIEANLPEGEFIGKIDDTYKDTLKVEYNEEDGQYHLNLYKNVGRELINKPATGSMDSDGTYPYFYFRGEPNLKADRFSAKLNYLSKAYNAADMANKENNNNTIYWASNSTFIRIDKFTTVEEYIEWLNSVDLILYAPLKAPYVVDLGVVDQLITYNEITNLFTDSDLLPTINAKYYRNFITTIQNLQVNEKALKQELIDINTRLSALESTITSVASESEVVE